MVSKDDVLEKHEKPNGKYEMISKVPLVTMDDLSTYYTPGVALVSLAIKEDKEKAYRYTSKANTIAIVSDATRILGLGDIGPEAGLPVMEGKAILFKKFGGVDAVPLCIDTKDENEIVNFVKWIAPTFGGINMEDISSPKTFSIVERLSRELSIPVFQDDNHGTAIVTLAGLLNALKLAGKDRSARIVMNGAGTAGIGITRLLLHAGFKNIIVVDSKGVIYEGRDSDMNRYKLEIAATTNHEKKRGNLSDVAAGADVLIGASKQGAFTGEMIRSMAEKPIVFALANPEPEIGYQEARAAGAFVVATGRSDTPNQVNNMIAFPGTMRGLLDVRAKAVHIGALEAASIAIAKCVGKRLGTEYIIPSFTDGKMYVKVAANVAEAVAAETVRLGLARITPADGEVKEHTKKLLKRYSRMERRVIGR